MVCNGNPSARAAETAAAASELPNLAASPADLISAYVRPLNRTRKPKPAAWRVFLLPVQELVFAPGGLFSQ